MKKIIGIVSVLIILGIAGFQIMKFLKGGENETTSTIESFEDLNPNVEPQEQKVELVNDMLYRWDTLSLDWVTVDPLEKAREKAPIPSFTSNKSVENSTKPIELDWPFLINIEYQLKYFEELKMELYAPVFSEELKALDGKEVIIKGFVIPFDETGDLVALSANPFASCFFCGKASPASVMSLYLKKKKLYKMDDFRNFRGTFKLNYDDPGEYYYILKKAYPVK